MIDVRHQCASVLQLGMSMTWVAAFWAAASAPVFAQEQDTINMHATYLAAPTEWCAADEGVPFMVKLDGPDLLDAPADISRTIEVNKGHERVFTHTKPSTRAFMRSVREGPPPEIWGRLQATYRGCDTPWDSHGIAGEWKITSPGGELLDSGTWPVDRGRYSAPPRIGLDWRLGLTEVQIGHRSFYTLGEPEIRKTQTFAAQAEKE